MTTKLGFNIENPSIETQLLIAEQEKALLRDEFEQSRHRLMVVSRKVQDLKAQLYFKTPKTN